MKWVSFLFFCALVTCVQAQESPISYKLVMAPSPALELNTRLQSGVVREVQELSSKQSEWSYALDVRFGGVSKHKATGPNRGPNTNHQQNPMVGVRLTLNYKVLGLRPLVEADHVIVNSRYGTTNLYGFGAVCEIGKIEKTNISVSVMQAHARATDVRGRVATAFGPVPTLTLEYETWSINVASLGRYVLFAFIGKTITF